MAGKPAEFWQLTDRIASCQELRYWVDKLVLTWELRNARQRWSRTVGVRTVAHDLGLGVSSVAVAHRRLRASGVLTVRQDRQPGQPVYEITIPVGRVFSKLEVAPAAGIERRPLARGLLAILSDEADDFRGAWAGNPHYAGRLGCGESRVWKARRVLVEAGELDLESDPRGRPRSYTLPLARERELSRQAARETRQASRRKGADLGGARGRKQREAARHLRQAASCLDPEPCVERSHPGPESAPTCSNGVSLTPVPAQGARGDGGGSARGRGARARGDGGGSARGRGATIEDQRERSDRGEAQSADFSPSASHDEADKPSGGAGGPGPPGDGGDLDTEPSDARWAGLTEAQRAPFRELAAEGQTPGYGSLAELTKGQRRTLHGKVGPKVPESFLEARLREQRPASLWPEFAREVRKEWARTHNSIQRCLVYMGSPYGSPPPAADWKAALAYSDDDTRQWIERFCETRRREAAAKPAAARQAPDPGPAEPKPQPPAAEPKPEPPAPEPDPVGIEALGEFEELLAPTLGAERAAKVAPAFRRLFEQGWDARSVFERLPEKWGQQHPQVLALEVATRLRGERAAQTAESAKSDDGGGEVEGEVEAVEAPELVEAPEAVVEGEVEIEAVEAPEPVEPVEVVVKGDAIGDPSADSPAATTSGQGAPVLGFDDAEVARLCEDTLAHAVRPLYLQIARRVLRSLPGVYGRDELLARYGLAVSEDQHAG